MKSARPPCGGGSGPKAISEFPKHNISQSLPFPQITDRSLLEVLRVIWWGQIRDGNRLPAEPGVILIEGGPT